MKFTKYTVNHMESGFCQMCGCPIYVGETAWEIKENDGTTYDSGFCTRQCAAQYAMETVE